MLMNDDDDDDELCMEGYGIRIRYKQGWKTIDQVSTIGF